MTVNINTEYRPGIDWAQYCEFWTNRLVRLRNFNSDSPVKIIRVIKSQITSSPLFWIALDRFGGGTRTVVGREGFEPLEAEAQDETPENEEN